MSRPTIQPEVAAAFLADYRDGRPVKDIAAAHRVSPETVRLYARKAGLDRRGGDYLGRCSACGAPRARVDGFCYPCGQEIPLTGGRWVLDPVRRVQVWEAVA